MARHTLILIAAAAALVALFGYSAWRAALLLESWESHLLASELAAAGHGWTRVEADGLRLRVTGSAPDAEAMTAAEALVARRYWATSAIVMSATLAGKAALQPQPELAFLRDGRDISVTGAAPEGAHAAIAALAEDAAAGLSVKDLTTVTAMTPDDWDPAFAFALAAVRATPQLRVVARPGVVAVDAAVGSAEERAALEASLRAAAPEGLELTLNIKSPPPALKPYRFAVEKTAGGVGVGACAAETEAQRAEIVAALSEALGFAGDCAIALGAPSVDWPAIVAAGVRAVAAVPAARFEVSDTEVRFTALAGTSEQAFETALRDLALGLSKTYSLVSEGPPKPAPAAEAPKAAPEKPAPKLWFRAARGAGGTVALQGEAPDEATRTAIYTYARALAGAAAVTGELSLAADLAPEGWRRAALAGLEALAKLDAGEARFDGLALHIVGATATPETVADVAAALAPKIADGLEAHTEITVDQSRIAAGLPLSPTDCVAELSAQVVREPISFAPASAKIGAESAAVLDALAATIKRCEGGRIEIGGHTDSQGRETTNQLLSQTRADAVLDALLRRGVKLEKLVAKGYGESTPIADNATEEGRARNRRIEFTLAETPQ